MKKGYLILYSFISLLIISSCSQSEQDATTIVNQSIEVHGGSLYGKSHISFDFRDRHYTSNRNGGLFQYTRKFEDSLGTIEDVLTNEGFHRTINQEPIDLESKKRDAYSNSVNSVHYFSQLPFGLNAPAVIKKYVAEENIKGNIYHKIQVTFKKEGGGEDFEDIFLYWINKESNTMDYLAYKYKTNGGGIRFREAIERLKVGGILFSNYINYKPESQEIDFLSIGELFNDGKLIEVSRIINENIEVKPAK